MLLLKLRQLIKFITPPSKWVSFFAIHSKILICHFSSHLARIIPSSILFQLLHWLEHASLVCAFSEPTSCCYKTGDSWIFIELQYVLIKKICKTIKCELSTPKLFTIHPDLRQNCYSVFKYYLQIYLMENMHLFVVLFPECPRSPELNQIKICINTDFLHGGIKLL